jgi:hypothetical protein
MTATGQLPEDRPDGLADSTATPAEQRRESELRLGDVGGADETTSNQPLTAQQDAWIVSYRAG